ncbi:hypothetical protein ACIOUE_21535 [Streptomyces xanthochromogenes]|uniref:hypothetical protein n=1 Tax=Streptomyces TaxID=1883 RepID=UPI0013693279|nr:hypothetical protein [Streptomyces sp. SID1034]MYV96114.1 hypothetical protein [Streptomyces sp. SID1034]
MPQEEQTQGRNTHYKVDASGKLGEVVGTGPGSVCLRPPGGGREWTVPPDALRDPTPSELERALILSTPVVTR